MRLLLLSGIIGLLLHVLSANAQSDTSRWRVFDAGSSGRIGERSLYNTTAYFLDSLNGYYGGRADTSDAEPEYHRTTDGGATWSPSETHEMPYVVSPTVRVTGDGKISRDGGRTYTHLMFGADSLGPFRTALAAGGDGVIVALYHRAREVTIGRYIAIGPTRLTYSLDAGE